MGTVTNRSLLSGCRGRVGPVVLSGNKSKDIMRIRPDKPGKKNGPTPQNKIFSNVTYLLRPIHSLIGRGFPQPRTSSKSPMNAAVGILIKDSIITEGNKHYFDLQKVKLSKPLQWTQTVWNPLIKAESGKKITVSWELNPFPQKCARPDDQVVIAYFEQETNLFSEALIPLERTTLTYTKKKTAFIAGTEIFVYLFVVSADRKLVSETEFLGSVTVLA